mmetsp:Transcript_60844/g.70633  ORF Transcript_60844/g.70633 Transcript_60844/m.70633 type:complete len:202 (-) Transcript_60844:44-649(-)
MRIKPQLQCPLECCNRRWHRGYPRHFRCSPQRRWSCCWPRTRVWGSGGRMRLVRLIQLPLVPHCFNNRDPSHRQPPQLQNQRQQQHLLQHHQLQRQLRAKESHRSQPRHLPSQRHRIFRRLRLLLHPPCKTLRNSSSHRVLPCTMEICSRLRLDTAVVVVAHFSTSLDSRTRTMAPCTRDSAGRALAVLQRASDNPYQSAV